MSDIAESEATTLSVQLPVEEDAAIHARRNYWVTVVEGGAFMGGLAFLNAQTMMPDMVRQLGGSPILIALAPSLGMLGFWIAPILTAHFVDGMHRYKPFCTLTGVVQRLPYLIAAIALWMASRDASSTFALAAVVAAPLISGIAGGISVTAWQQLISRCIPERRRASLFATRYIIACVMGFGAGLLAKYLFTHMPLLSAYAALHLVAFFFLTVSFFIFLMTREPHSPKPEIHTLTLRQNLLLMPQLIRLNHTFRRYLASRLLRNGFLVITPFLAIYARDTLDRPESFLGTLVMATMIGAIVGNLGAAKLGDRYGGKLVNQLALAMYVAVSAWAIFAGTAAEFIIIFAVVGAAQFAGEVGGFTLMLEILPKRNRATYLAIASLVNVPGMFLAGWISSALWKYTGSITWLAIVTMVTLVGSILLLHPLAEPRQAAGRESS